MNIRAKGFKHFTGINETLEIIFKSMRKQNRGNETLQLDQALNRVLASDIISDMNIPESDRSAMDGYAVISEDTFGVSENNPITLRIIGRIEIGEIPRVQIRKGEAVAVATGSCMPKGADAVVKVEYTKKIKEDKIRVVEIVVPHQNVAKTGEDVKKGQIVLKKGTKIMPQDIGLLAALGKAKVSVIRKPIVAIISTGNELIDVSENRREAKIFDINRPMTKASIISIGGEPLDLGISLDNTEEIRKRLEQALSASDIVLISAGTSVGEKDLIPDVLNSFNGPGLLIHGVSIKPGYPTGLAVINGKPVISLPGYPVSNAIAFRVLVKPLLARILETKEDNEPVVRARISRRVATPGGLRTFVRVKISKGKKGLIAEPIMAAGAGVISSLSSADGLLIVNEDCEGVDEGEEVEVVLLRPIIVR